MCLGAESYLSTKKPRLTLETRPNYPAVPPHLAYSYLFVRPGILIVCHPEHRAKGLHEPSLPTRRCFDKLSMTIAAFSPRRSVRSMPTRWGSYFTPTPGNGGIHRSAYWLARSASGSGGIFGGRRDASHTTTHSLEPDGFRLLVSVIAFAIFYHKSSSHQGRDAPR
jgi:hypothetical protein